LNNEDRQPDEQSSHNRVFSVPTSGSLKEKAELFQEDQHNQPQGGHKAELKAHVPQNQRIEGGQGQAGGEQGIYGRASPP